MDIAGQIAKLEATLTEKRKQLNEVLQKSADEERSTDAAEAEQFDTLKTEIKSLEKDLERWREVQRMDAATVKDVDGTKSANQPARTALNTLQLKKQPKKLAPGIAFARYARCKGLSYMDQESPRTIAKSLYPDDEQLVQRLTKAAVPAANTSDATWAGNLVLDEGGIFGDFVEFLRPMTVLGKFGNDGIPSLRRVPFRTALLSQATGGSGYWVGEGKPKPLTNWTFGKTTLEPLKVANIAVSTMELLRDSSTSADMLIRDELANALRERMDTDFIDPGKAASTGVSPASILNGVAGINSSGNDADDVRADVKSVFEAFIAGNNTPTSGVWIMPASTALSLSLMQNPLGQPEFSGIGMAGGRFFGLPVIVSEYAVRDTEGSVVSLINASDIYFADEGGIEVSVSREASLEMDNAPTNTSAPSGSVAETTQVSLWQTNSVGFLAERTVNWARRRVASVAYLTGVDWGTPS